MFRNTGPYTGPMVIDPDSETIGSRSSPKLVSFLIVIITRVSCIGIIINKISFIN